MWNNFINDSISRLSSEQSLETYSFVKHVGELRDDSSFFTAVLMLLSHLDDC